MLILVDDWSILTKPVFLTVADPICRVVTTREAIDSVKAVAGSDRRFKYVGEALDLALLEGTIVELPADADAPVVYRTSALRLPEVTIINAALASRATTKTEDMWVSLRGEEAARMANALGLRATTPGMVSYVLRNYAKHQALELSVKGFVRRYAIGTFIGLLLLFALVYLGYQAVALIGRHVGDIHPLTVMCGVALFAAAAFWFREHFRLHYGFAEFFAGCILAVTAVVPRHTSDTVGLPMLLQLLAGAFVIIRGLENIGKAVVDTPLEKWWRQIF
jgi:hypothetical protein